MQPLQRSQSRRRRAALQPLQPRPEGAAAASRASEGGPSSSAASLPRRASPSSEAGEAGPVSQRIYAKTTSSEGTSAEVGQHASWQRLAAASLPSLATCLDGNSPSSSDHAPSSS